MCQGELCWYLHAKQQMGTGWELMGLGVGCRLWGQGVGCGVAGTRGGGEGYGVGVWGWGCWCTNTTLYAADAS